MVFCVGLGILVGIIASVFFKGNPKGFDEAKKMAIENAERLPGVEKVISSDFEIVGYKSDIKAHMIVISVKVKASKESNGEPTLFFVAGIDKDGKVKNIKFSKIVKSGGDKSAVIKEMKEHFKTLKFEIK